MLFSFSVECLHTRLMGGHGGPLRWWAVSNRGERLLNDGHGSPPVATTTTDRFPSLLNGHGGPLRWSAVAKVNTADHQRLPARRNGNTYHRGGPPCPVFGHGGPPPLRHCVKLNGFASILWRVTLIAGDWGNATLYEISTTVQTRVKVYPFGHSDLSSGAKKSRPAEHPSRCVARRS